MGIEKFLLSISVQTAVYWANPTKDGFGGHSFDDPVEIAVRWQSTQKLVMGDQGVETLSVAEVIVNQDVVPGEYLFLGELTDLDSDEEDDPKAVTGAYRIIAFEKIPMIKKTDEFVRTAYLGAAK